MLVECSRCGAPLAVESGARTTRCQYCGATTQIASTRTIALVTPAGWAQPQRWDPSQGLQQMSPQQRAILEQVYQHLPQLQQQMPELRAQLRQQLQQPAPQLQAPHYQSVVARGVKVQVIFMVVSMLVALGIGAVVMITQLPDDDTPWGASGAASSWDARSTLRCDTNQHLTLEDLATPPGVSLPLLIDASTNCEVTLRRARLSGGTLLRAGTNVVLRFEDSTFSGDALVEGGSNVELYLTRSGAEVDRLADDVGSNFRLDVRGPGELTVRKTLVNAGANARVRFEGVTILADRDGIHAGSNLHATLRSTRLVAKGAAFRADSNAELDLEDSHVEGNPAFELSGGQVTLTQSTLEGERRGSRVRVTER